MVSDSPQLPSHSIPATEFRPTIEKELEKVAKRRQNFIEKDFNELDDLERSMFSQRGQRCSSALKRENVRKNRYFDILPGDATRVLLKTTSDTEGDYINANLIDGSTLFGIETRSYIATQGPTPETIMHFWIMILEQRCPVILSLTSLEERGMIKCDRYWPTVDEQTMQLGDMTVTLEDQSYVDEGRDIVERILTVRRRRHDGTDESHTTAMYHFEAWPDHGVPSTTDSFRHLLRLTDNRVREQQQQQQGGDSGSVGPVCVHCSAGVGRTGTFIAVDVVLEQFKKHQSQGTLDKLNVDVLNIVAVMKSLRPGMVQRRPQYVFVFRVLAQELAEMGL